MSAGILVTELQSLVRAIPSHTQSEVCPLQFALLGVVTRLVDGSCLCGVCCGLLQESVGADRGWCGRVVKEGDDILLSGLMQQNTVSSVSL